MHARTKREGPLRLSGIAETEFFGGLVAVARQLGFAYCGYSTRLPKAGGRVLVTCDNYPAAWQSRYREMGYEAVDPAINIAMDSDAPLLWPADAPSVASAMSRDADAHGLGFGWMKSARDIRGSVGVLSLARGKGAVTAEELNAKAAMMSWLANVAHAGLFRLFAREYAFVERTGLSGRELEVLRWSADGKTAAEIGLILGIAERTVVFHVNRVVDKLGVSTKIHAVARAVWLGLV